MTIHCLKLRRLAIQFVILSPSPLAILSVAKNPSHSSGQHLETLHFVQGDSKYFMRLLLTQIWKLSRETKVSLLARFVNYKRSVAIPSPRDYFGTSCLAMTKKEGGARLKPWPLRLFYWDAQIHRVAARSASVAGTASTTTLGAFREERTSSEGLICGGFEWLKSAPSACR